VTPRVDVIVDPHDDIATAMAIRELAACAPGVLAVSIAPGSQAEPAVVWAILRALGKRIEQLGRTKVKVYWMDGQRWLVAHAITEIVVLCAQHLGGVMTNELEREIGGRLGIALVLVYSGPARPPRPATTTLGALLARPRRPLPTTSRVRAWPRVPRSHPLRLRYDCFKRLSADEFERVDRLLVGSLRTLGAWQYRAYVSRGQVRRALRVISTADDPEQAYIRCCGAQLALLCDGIPVPRTRPLKLRGRSLTNAHIDAIHSYTAPWVAGYVLAELITGLPPVLLDVIAGDQIADDAILGCRVPDRARAVLRALETDHEAVLDGPRGAAYEPPRATRHASWSQAEQLFAAAIRWLLRGRAARIPVSDMNTRLRARFDQLGAAGIVERNRGVYQASHIALYSSYRLPAPPIPALTGE
jgi:hypothetical protein